MGPVTPPRVEGYCKDVTIERGEKMTNATECEQSEEHMLFHHSKLTTQGEIFQHWCL